jgi:hypothetical protein
MRVSELLKTYQAVESDGGSKITGQEMQNLISELAGQATPDELSNLSSALSDSAFSFASEATHAARSLIDNQDAAAAPAVSSDIQLKYGTNGNRSFDDSAIFGASALKDGGRVAGTTGIDPVTRGYAALNDGVLQRAHGSQAPESLGVVDIAALRATPPGEQLKAAAEYLGQGQLRFDEMPNWQQFYDTSQPSWAGKCHAWAWYALDQILNTQIDVPGPSGMRGLWIAGQWMSRADLATWAMAVLDQISINDTRTGGVGILRGDPKPNAKDILLGVGEYLFSKESGGAVGDVHRDVWPGNHGSKEVWNQPFIEGQINMVPKQGNQDFGALPDAAEKAIVDLAKREGHSGAKAARLVHVEGRYGVEAGDTWENDPRIADRDWHMYVVTDSAGKMVEAYWASDDKLQNIEGLPVQYTDQPLEYWWKPTLSAIKAIRSGQRNSVVDNNKLGPEARFFIGTVLGKGVTGEARKAFEDALKAGKSPSELSQNPTFKNVGHAYNTNQWNQMFQALGQQAPDIKQFMAS